MTVSRALAILGSVLVLIAISGLAFFDQLQALFGGDSHISALIPPSPAQVTISSVETDENCQVQITLVTDEAPVAGNESLPEKVVLPTNFNPATSQCQEYMLKLIAPSKNFLAYEDLDSAGGDTLVKSWSTADRQTREIGSVAPDSVIDMTFLPGDILAILHGKNLSRGKQTIRLYDLDRPLRPFITLDLTDATQHYYFIASQNNQLSVYGPEGIKASPIQSWPLDELMPQFNDI
ncbi:MAG: hypothetical protein ABIJ03_03880 [Patescibacteria group bacterium]